MADFEDLPGFAPPPTRPAGGFGLEAERRAHREPEPDPLGDESLVYKMRVAVGRAAGSSSAMLFVASILVAGTMAISGVAGGSRTPIPSRPRPAPVESPRPRAEVPPAATDRQKEATAPNRKRALSKYRREKATFRFTAAGGTTTQEPTQVDSAAPAPTSQGSSGSRPHASRPSPRPSPTPYTPTAILMRLTHPNGAYFFTTSLSAATEKEGYEGYESERAALVWPERRGPTMIRLELSDDSVAFVYAREQDVRTGEPRPLYSASTRRYGRFYSLDRAQAAEVGPVVIYGWVATY